MVIKELKNLLISVLIFFIKYFNANEINVNILSNKAIFYVSIIEIDEGKIYERKDS